MFGLTIGLKYIFYLLYHHLHLLFLHLFLSNWISLSVVLFKQLNGLLGTLCDEQSDIYHHQMNNNCVEYNFGTLKKKTKKQKKKNCLWRFDLFACMVCMPIVFFHFRIMVKHTHHKTTTMKVKLAKAISSGRHVFNQLTLLPLRFSFYRIPWELVS